MWPYVALSAATALAVPASAIGVGYLRPVQRTRAPGFWIVARILRLRRGRPSLLFLIRYGWLRDAPQPVQADVSAALLGLALGAREGRQIRGLYLGLAPELGSFLALATCVEIVRNLRANGK